MAALSEAILLGDVSRGGSSRSEEGESEPRLKEQPPSARPISASEAAARGEARKTPDERDETGMTIAANCPRARPSLVARRAAKNSFQNNNADRPARVQR